MKLGMNIRNWGPTATPDFLRACAEAADKSTLDAIWFNDHIGLPPKLENNDYGIPDDMGAILDPLAFSNFLAAVTRRIHFGTAVLIIPYRSAILTNKLIATI
ncbi:MAG: LLM class flavin-dependent oxidoreductase, partial [Gammaproteobacteria bacterium]|nr:LLM class flavin-dependent oxidoreductase [Gammaproteobacteria bacterium]